MSDHVRALPPENLTAARALTGDARAVWRRSLLWQQIEDLNAAYDRLANATEPPTPDDTRVVARILRASAIVRTSAIEAAREFLREQVEREEDAFGPAVILLGLAGDDDGVRTWASSLGQPLLRPLRALGLVR